MNQYCPVCGAEMFTWQKPLTLAEVMEIGKYDDNIVYLEHRDPKDRDLYNGWYDPVTEYNDEGVCFYAPGVSEPSAIYYCGYNKAWRCWLYKPTAEETKAATWG